MLEEHPEQAFIEGGRPMMIGAGEPGTVGVFTNPEMLELAKATGQSSANLPERIRMGEMSEEHGDKPVPAAEPLCFVFSAMVDDQFLEMRTGDMLKKLTKQTRNPFTMGYATSVGDYPPYNTVRILGTTSVERQGRKAADL